MKRWWPLIVFGLAVLMRVGAFGRYVTPDEMAWVYRSVRLREALLAADWAHTIQTSHPGVTTTWLGAIGIQIGLWVQPWLANDVAFVENLYWLSPNYGHPFQKMAGLLPWGRGAVVFVQSALVVSVFFLVRRRWGWLAALFASLLLATEPFIAGLSGLLHTDALLGIFCVLALLTLTANGGRRTTVLAGIFSALAVLSKLPGLVWVGLAPLILVFSGQYSVVSKNRHTPNTVYRILNTLAFWAIAFTLTAIITLPAIWAGPE